ncbi:replicative DNA helicase [Thiotrichales bacterium 19X7-9]|nr:replicative DNA helicase [Thiotrichales bacterium 19X7-9]
MTTQEKLYEIEAERSILGSLLIDNDCYDKISDKIEVKDFYDRRHQLIFTHIQRLLEVGTPLDAVTLGDILEDAKLLDDAGGLAYLADIARHTPTSSNCIAYTEIVKRRAIKRHLRQALVRSNELINNNIDEHQLIDEVEKEILSVRAMAESDQHDFKSAKELLPKFIDQLEAKQYSENGITGIPTGFIDLDKKTAGLHPSQLIVVAGRPSMGKTTFAMNIAENVLKETDKSVLVFSLEMSADEILERRMSSVGNIHLSNLRTGKLSEGDWGKVSIAIECVKDRKMTIVDTPALTPLNVKHKARAFKRQNPDLGLIVVDYLQLMQVHESGLNRTQEVTKISNELKAIAKELSVPVIAISQLNRSVDDRADRRPRMSDLRESGAIEQDADVILFVYREEVYDRDKPEAKGKAEIVIGKQRNGGVGSIGLLFKGENCKFTSMALNEDFH